MTPTLDSSLSNPEIKPYRLQKVCGKRTFSAQFYGEAGPVVVCLHGFPDTLQTFQRQIPALVKAGFRVLVPVLPGYDVVSQHPQGRYYLTELVDWLVGWLDFIDEEKVHLVGHDWGAGIAWMTALMQPRRVLSLTSIAIPSLRHLPRGLLRHPGQLFRSWYMSFFQLPGLPERLLTLRGGWLVRRLWRAWSPGWTAPEAELAAVCQTLQQPGVPQAVVDYYRCLFNLLDPASREARRWINRPLTPPLLLITGARDGCMDTRLFDQGCTEADFPGGVDLFRLMGAGHFCHQEKPESVNRVLLEFLRAHTGATAGRLRPVVRQPG